MAIFQENRWQEPGELMSGLGVDRASATEAVDTGSIPGRVKPKTIKIGIHSFPAIKGTV